jgi:hypothetical protein
VLLLSGQSRSGLFGLAAAGIQSDPYFKLKIEHVKTIRIIMTKNYFRALKQVKRVGQYTEHRSFTPIARQKLVLKLVVNISELEIWRQIKNIKIPSIFERLQSVRPVDSFKNDELFEKE